MSSISKQNKSNKYRFRPIQSSSISLLRNELQNIQKSQPHKFSHKINIDSCVTAMTDIVRSVYRLEDDEKGLVIESLLRLLLSDE